MCKFKHKRPRNTSVHVSHAMCVSRRRHRNRPARAHWEEMIHKQARGAIELAHPSRVLAKEMSILV
jgi:hypothetical protein